MKPIIDARMTYANDRASVRVVHDDGTITPWGEVLEQMRSAIEEMWACVEKMDERIGHDQEEDPGGV